MLKLVGREKVDWGFSPETQDGKPGRQLTGNKLLALWTPRSFICKGTRWLIEWSVAFWLLSVRYLLPSKSVGEGACLPSDLAT